MHPIVDKLFNPFEKIIGIDVQCDNNGLMNYHYCILQQQKQQLQIIEQKENISDLSAFLVQYKNLPICINISGQGILLKKNPIPQNEIAAIYDVIPNVEVKQFYWHQENIAEESWIAIAKNSWVETIKNTFKDFSILAITLGPLSMEYIKSYLKNQTTIITHSYQINIAHEAINFQSQSASLVSHQMLAVSEEKILINNLVAFSAVVKYLTAPIEIISTRQESVIDDFKYKIIFKKSLIGVLATVLIALLINTVLFMNSSNQLADLQLKAGSNADKIIVDSLRNLLSSQSNYMKDAGWAETSKSSYYADRIAQSVDNSHIRLSDLNIYPIDITVEDTLKFKHQLIQISGISKNAYDVNEWKKKLEAEKWAKKVVLNDFTFTNDNDYAVFTLLIEL